MSVHLSIAPKPDAPLLPPYPRGWYVIAESSDLRPGDVKTVKAFGREVVVFRTDDGEAHVVNAHCPHLGAHLGHGGRVCGDRLRCPFHGWEFEGRSGKCVKLASGDPVPAKAELRRWTVDERYGLVLVWFHDEGEPPTWTVEFEDMESSWSDWSTHTWEFKARIQDVGENDADIAHSPVMHGLTGHLPKLEMQTDGPVCDWRMDVEMDRWAFGLPNLPGRLYDALRVPKSVGTVINVRRSGFSLGLIHARTSLPGGFELNVQTLCSTTPIDADHVRSVARHRTLRTPLRPLTRIIRYRFAKTFNTTFEEDVEIWKHKVYRVRPIASKSDWAVLKFRRWAKQFYAEGVYESALAREEAMRREGTLP